MYVRERGGRTTYRVVMRWIDWLRYVTRVMDNANNGAVSCRQNEILTHTQSHTHSATLAGFTSVLVIH